MRSTWQTVVTKATSRKPRWGGPTQIFHDVDAKARYVRIEFTQLQDGAWASIREFGAYPETVGVRLLRCDVHVSAALERRDVRAGRAEGGGLQGRPARSARRSCVRPASPAAIRLTPDRKELSATGEDLCYVLVEALDAKGTLCPLADNLFGSRWGPAEIAGVGNGNPLSIEPFQADYRKLFFGKAMLILRTREGRSGKVHVTAESDGLSAANVTLQCR